MSKQIRRWIKEKKNELKEQSLIELQNLMQPQPQQEPQQSINQEPQQSINQEPQQSINQEANRFMKLVKQLSVKFGEKSTVRYTPLIRYVSRNPKMLELLEELLEKSSQLQSSIGKKVFDN